MDIGSLLTPLEFLELLSSIFATFPSLHTLGALNFFHNEWIIPPDLHSTMYKCLQTLELNFTFFQSNTELSGIMQLGNVTPMTAPIWAKVASDMGIMRLALVGWPEPDDQVGGSGGGHSGIGNVVMEKLRDLLKFVTVLRRE
ncbi:hypothetical protein M427DRAFT_49649 [Gonapodya prolifera JEL478]|uniref:Uncharacterized protein n=1 Tax=Gonapodya prolifera (strain JEL478) TaxID=1344416 RepID=A0A138ZY16_GONPJ|nr:hypothetical protein M427DRAFT_49649 [Gonapodya prolifera JEL478]|eukprot:KXS09384.1 hypothetical protein M427DRAFT_49649 [Gonapodya prolifera JEL478]